MRSLFYYSRFVYRGGLEGAKDTVRDAAKTGGEAVGEYAEKAISFAKRIEFWKTTKGAAKEAWDGFNRKFYPLENRPTDPEKTKRLIEFVAVQIGVTTREVRDALYTPHTQDSDPAKGKKRHDILKKIVVMQGYLPEIELYFAGITQRLDRSITNGAAGGGASGAPSAGPSVAAGGAGGEKAPDGKEGERLDPVADLDAYAKKNKWKGVRRDPKASLVPFAKDIPLVRETSLAKSDPYDYAHLAKNIAPIERALKDIASNPRYKEFWPLLPEVMVTITPNHVLDINIFSEGFSWSDETLKIDYNESEDGIREDLLIGLKEYNAYKKLGGKETSSERAERMELARQMELFIKNYDLLFTKNDADKNAWKNNLAEAKDPARFALRIEGNPSYVQEQLAAIRKSVRDAYVYKTWEYIDQFDAKIGAGKKDGGQYTKENWVAAYENIKKNTTNPDAQNIEVVVPMVRFYKSNLEGKPVPLPKTPASGGEAGKEKSPEIGAERARAARALASISGATGYPISMLPTRVRDNIYTYDYAEIAANVSAIQKAIKGLDASETPERKAILRNIGLSPTPKRTWNYKVRQEGFVKLPDGEKQILFKVCDDADEMAAAISKGIDEVQEENSRGAKESEKDRSPELPKEALRKKIIVKVKDITAWYALSPEDREDDNFAGTGMSLEKIAKVFGVSGDPATEDYAYRKLGNEIYGVKPTPEESGDSLKLKAERMLLQMSDKYGFNIRLQPDVEYDYDDILSSRTKFHAAFSAVKPSTKSVLAKAGVVLGEVSMSGDQEGVIKAPDGKYRIAIDWNEDAGEIITQLDTYANKYESEAKDLREEDVDDMSDAQVRAANDKKLKKILDVYKVKYVYEDGFNDDKDLSAYIDAIKRAFDGLSGADKEVLKRGEYQIVISEDASDEGLISDHTILIDYDDGIEDIKKDLSEGIEEQEGKKNFLLKGYDATKSWLKKKLIDWR